MQARDTVGATQGSIFQIQRWSVHDGEGIRSTVFFKGCPLRCQWCANPESWRRRPEVLYLHERCTHCGRCAATCTTGAAAKADDGSYVFDRRKCERCLSCCDVCPSGARKSIGSALSVSEVMRTLSRDAIFYRESGGGVTFSGGEPFAQPEFLRQLVAACNRLGIDTAVETCGYFNWGDVADIAARLDGAFIDIKHMDSAVHQRLTRVGNQRILDNVIRLSETVPNVVVRVPLIASINDDAENFHALSTFLRDKTRVKAVELLPYHELGEAKYRAVGAQAHTFHAPDAEKIRELESLIRSYGIELTSFK